MTTFKLPELGEGIDNAEVTRLLVKPGDVIKADQNVMELDSEKASFPLPCPNAGKIAKIHVKEGQAIKVGQPLLDVEETAEAGEPTRKPPREEKSEEKAAEQNGPENKDRHEKPPKEKTPSPSRAAREEAKTAALASSEAEESTEPPDGTSAPKKDGHLHIAAVEQREPPRKAPAPAGPATRRLARELGVNLHDVRGSGPQGRITRDDLKAYVQQRLTSLQPSQEAPALPDFSRWGTVRREKMTTLARTAAQRLSLAWRTIPHVTQHELADVTDLEAARKKYIDKSKDGKTKITMTVLCVHAAVAALKQFPKFNSSLDMPAGELIFKDYYHIGVAVDTEYGLLAPVLRDADRKTMVELAHELDELARKARQRALAPKDMEGATFTISNLGGIGGTAFSPIINHPEVAILGISSARWQPVIRGGKTEPRLMLPLSLSYDHRVINGADAARFIVRVAGLLSGAFELLAES
jgi:pyruvate dehydrogenase E2 component (dihydrolipoamide acetyltransferase)